jgi:predicted component of type VI protein secretion system
MSPASFRLVMRTGPNPGTAFELDKEVMLIGRDVTNEIMIGDAEVSRQHARLTRTEGGYVLEDLGSTNGTFVGGERLMAPRVLNPSDLVGLGETVTLTYESTAPEAAETVARPAAAPAPQPAPAPPVQAPAPPAPVPHAAAPAPAQAQAPLAGADEGLRRRLPLLLAGGGCLVLILACAAVLWFMPQSWWCLLLSPLQFLGFNFPGCG